MSRDIVPLRICTAASHYLKSFICYKIYIKLCLAPAGTAACRLTYSKLVYALIEQCVVAVYRISDKTQLGTDGVHVLAGPWLCLAHRDARARYDTYRDNRIWQYALILDLFYLALTSSSVSMIPLINRALAKLHVTDMHLETNHTEG
jgi:hypothetical protein